MKNLIGNFTPEQARQICSYENQMVVDAIASDHPAYYPKIEKLLYHNIRVLDFGGGSGGIYRSVRDKINILKWTVVETPAMCRQCRKYEDDILEFTKYINGDYEIVIASGSLQYVPNWRKTLIELLGIGADLYIFARMSFGKERTALQKSRLSDNGNGNNWVRDRFVFYPHTIIPKREFKQMIQGVNYKIIGG